MEGLGLVFESIMNTLPLEAQKQLISELQVSKRTCASPIGAILIGMHLLEYVGFPKYVDEILDEKHWTIEQMREYWHSRTDEQEYLVPSTGTILSLMVADMIACPRTITPAYKFEEMAKKWCTGPLLGIEPSLLNDDRIGRSMSKLGTTSQNLQDVLFNMLMDAARKAAIPLQKFILDTTLLQLDGSFKQAPKVVPGRGQDSFSQLIVSLVIASGSRLPVGFGVLAGNTSDSTTLPGIYETVHKVADEGAVEFLMDRIYPTPSNIRYLKEHEHERMVYWVSPLKMGLSGNRVRQAIDTAYNEGKWVPIAYRSLRETKANIEPPLSAYETNWTLIETIKPELEPGQTRRPKGSIKTIELDVRCVFYRHARNAEKQQEARTIQKDKLDDALKEFCQKLNSRKYRQIEFCQKKLLDLLNSYSSLKPFLLHEFQLSQDGVISLHWSWNYVALEEEAKYDGIFALLTNYGQTKVNHNKLVTKYRGRDQVEVNFKDMRGLLDLERVLYHRPERIDTYIFLKVIAMFVLAFLRSYAQQNGVKTTEKDLQKNMGDVLLIENTIEPLDMKIYSIARDTELNLLFRTLFTLPDPHYLIEVLNDAEKCRVDEYVANWYQTWYTTTSSP